MFGVGEEGRALAFIFSRTDKTSKNWIFVGKKWACEVFCRAPDTDKSRVFSFLSVLIGLKKTLSRHPIPTKMQKSKYCRY